MESGAVEDSQQAPRVAMGSRAAPAQGVADELDGAVRTDAKEHANARPGAPRPSVGVEHGRTVMRVGGVIQSVLVDERYTADVWDALMPRRRPARALILGLGGGTIAALMLRRWGALSIVGVERDPAVVALARREFGLAQVEQSGALRIVTGDAFAFVRAAARANADRQRAHVGVVADAGARRHGELFDAICVDMYTAGKMAHGVLAPAFLRDVARLLAPDGEMTINLWRSAYLDDQLRRIRRELHIQELALVDDNVVAHCVTLS
ncbi:MAG TPA: hypothetical protein VMV29_02515 [Ktedonobacterales bacterium]|nr:hypothetical protein [Ktedonobacterales bacterium]